MDAYRIRGGFPLRGTLRINGSKNAALPCLYASLLTPEPLELRRIPDLRDTHTAVHLLHHLGKKVVWKSAAVQVQERRVNMHRRSISDIPYELVRQMRASVLSAGPLLARWGKTVLALPGGCSIGSRPINIHVDGFKAMGAKVETVSGNLLIRAPANGLKAVRLRLPFASVGATENLMLAAALIKGETVLFNAAREPEIADLASLLNLMGACVTGAGTATIRIRGRAKLCGAVHSVIADRLETGTFATFAACVGGSNLRLEDCDPSHLEAFLEKLKQAGVHLERGANWLHIQTSKGFRPKAVSLVTKPHPGFPTDLQPLWMALMTRARGKAVIEETVFERRLMHAAEMNRMGASIRVDANKAIITGRPELFGAHVMASDIRAGAGLIACALSAKGETVISRIYHVERGYSQLEKKLSSIGSHIRRFTEIKYKRVS